VFGDQHFVADTRANAELLVNLAAQAGLVRFARLALASGKLPRAAEMSPGCPASDEEPAVPFDEGGDDDDG
jgi:hypothetical protein